MSPTPTPEWSKCFSLLSDPSVSEVECNGPNLFFIKRSGKRYHLEDIRLSEADYLRGIEESLIPFVRHFREKGSEDDRWDHGYIFEGPLELRVGAERTRIKGRTHIVLPPVSDTPQITIAKKSTSLVTLDAIAAKGSMAVEMKQFLEACVRARMTTVFSGGTGAGKALHRDTLLPTPQGWRTVGEVEVGDLLFDEASTPTAVKRKYCPLDPESFLLVFKNEEQVLASGGHLWLVEAGGAREVVETRELPALLSAGRVVVPAATASEQLLEVFPQAAPQALELQAVLPRTAAPEDFYCFEVEAASHLFLCTESFIPTHNTTMLEACAKHIPLDTRIGVAEDTPELELPQLNVSYLHSVPWAPKMNPNDVATLDWCVAQFNRMRTDMLIIGETRGKEFASFLTAANSGMDGCLTTIHSNTPARCLEKMSNFALKGSERQPIRAVNSDIANSINIIVQLIILPDGRHRVSSISEVTNTVGNDEKAQITTNELYRYNVADDSFIKGAYFTDSLRRLWEERSVPYQPFAVTKLGDRLASFGETAPPPPSRPGGGGLPIPGGGGRLL